MKRTLTISLGLVALASLVVVMATRKGDSQPANAPRVLRLGIYAPTVPFATSGARSAYLRTLGNAIQTRTGIKVTVSSYTSLAGLRGVDFAIVEGQCYAANRMGTLLATARVGGSTSRQWALFSRVGSRLQSLKGRRLSYVKMGCLDTAFWQHAMLSSEVNARYFSARVPRRTLSAAVADVATYKGAEAVFAPIGSQKGLTKVFNAGSVPNPAFVQVRRTLPKSVVNKVRAAVVSFGASGAIGGWAAGRIGLYTSLRARMNPRTHRGVFARPKPVQVNVGDILIQPKTLDETRLTDVDQHFGSPPKRQE